MKIITGNTKKALKIGPKMSSTTIFWPLIFNNVLPLVFTWLHNLFSVVEWPLHESLSIWFMNYGFLLNKVLTVMISHLDLHATGWLCVFCVMAYADTCQCICAWRWAGCRGLLLLNRSSVLLIKMHSIPLWTSVLLIIKQCSAQQIWELADSVVI